MDSNKKLYLTIKGNGHAPVLFFHGLWGGGNYFRELELLDPKQYTQYFPDQLGFGKSEKPNITYSSKIHCEKLYECLPKKENLTLIGHSYGTVLATKFAELYPKVVKQIVLICPLLYQTQEEAKEYLSHNFICKLTIKRSFFAKAICKMLCSTHLLSIVSPAFVSKNRRGYIRGCTSHTWYSYYSTFMNSLIPDSRFEKIQQLSSKFPISIIYGNRDYYIQYSLIETVTGKKLQKKEFSGSHNLLFEKFDEVKQQILAWL